MTALAAALLVFGGLLLVRAVLGAGERRAVVAGPRRPLPHAPRRVVRALDDAACPFAADVVWTAWLGATVVATVVGVGAGGPGLALVLVVAAVAGPLVVIGGRRGRHGRLVDAALPDVLDGIARSLRSGATLGLALDEAVADAPRPLAGQLADVVDDAAGGVALTAALDAWPGRCPTPGVRLAATALALSTESGGAAARAVDGVAATLRANAAVAGEVRAQSSQARMSAMVIALAPLAFGALAAGTDGRTAAFLLRSRFGLACLGLGLTLDAVAAWWMQRITAVAA